MHSEHTVHSRRGNMRKLLVTATFLSLTVGLAGGQTQRSTGKTASRPPLPAWLTIPMSPQQQRLDSVDADLRRLRGESHMRAYDQATPLDATNVDPVTKRHSMRFSDYLGPPSQMPTKESDIVVLGTATEFAQFLTPDRRHMYAELTLTPVHFFKGSSTATPIIVRQAGGSLKLPNHRVAYDPPPSGSYPLSVDTPYVLFLKFLPKTKDYIVLSAWAVDADRPQSLDRDGRPVQQASSPNFATSQTLFAKIQESVAQAEVNN